MVNKTHAEGFMTLSLQRISINMAVAMIIAGSA
jgi:hypothetical protein